MKSFLVIGLGRFGSSVAVELCKFGYEVLAVDDREPMVQKIADQVTHAVVGDAKEESVLRSIGVNNFDCAIVAIGGELEDSILVTLMLREMGTKEIICKAQSDLHMKVLYKVGADKVVFPERDMGKRLAQSLTSSHIIDYIQLSDEYSIVEIAPPVSWQGRSIADIDVRANYGVSILAIRNKTDDNMLVSPTPNYVFTVKDMMIITGSNEDIRILGDIK